MMASAVRAFEHQDAEREFLRKIVKIATSEIVSSKVSDTVNISPVHFLSSVLDDELETKGRMQAQTDTLISSTKLRMTQNITRIANHITSNY